MTIDHSNQTSLFDLPPRPALSPLKRRHDAMEAAYKAADAAFKVEYEAFILRYLEKHSTGTAEDMRLAYEAARLPQTPNSKRCSGGIFVRLKRRGLIEDAGMKRSALYGNKVQQYKLTK